MSILVSIGTASTYKSCSRCHCNHGFSEGPNRCPYFSRSCCQRSMVYRPWSMDYGPRTMAHGPWTMVRGPWSMDHGPWIMVHGPWSMDCDPWTMVHGPWYMYHAPWSMGDGTWTKFLPRRASNLPSAIAFRAPSAFFPRPPGFNTFQPSRGQSRDALHICLHGFCLPAVICMCIYNYHYAFVCICI